jgi:hypothetical protein
MTNKIAIITGITGQDGAYLAKLLLSKDCAVLSRIELINLKDTLLWMLQKS